MSGAWPFPVPRTAFTGRRVLFTRSDDGVVEALADGFGACGAAVGSISPGKPLTAQFSDAERALGGPIDTLILGRGPETFGAAELDSPETFRHRAGEPTEHAIACASEFARRRLGQGGVVLALCGSPPDDGRPGAALAGLADAALETLVRSWAVEWAEGGVRVNAIALGLFEDRPHPGVTWARERGLDPADTVPLGRLGRAGDAVALALYLCSHYAAYVTGATVVLDGGESLRPHLGGPDFTAPSSRLPTSAQP